MIRACVRPVAVLLAVSCVPDLEDDQSLVAGARVLAIVADPPEVGEGDPVTLSALVASDGADVSSSVDYSLCLARKPLSELGPIDPSCLDPGSPSLVPLGRGASVQASIDRDACTAFGPRRPSPMPGEPAGRAADPDATGGFYQPVLATLPGQAPVLGGVRLDCGLSGAERAVVIDYNQRHRPNRNIDVARVELGDGERWTALESDAVATVAAGERVSLRVSWATCETDEPCSGRESYVLFDPESRTLVDRTEDVVAAWYASAGHFEEHRSEARDEAPGQAQNEWVAPAEPGRAGLWVVLRDGRGGLGYAAYPLEIR